jgi:hypothetical protein
MKAKMSLFKIIAACCCASKEEEYDRPSEPQGNLDVTDLSEIVL